MKLIHILKEITIQPYTTRYFLTDKGKKLIYDLKKVRYILGQYDLENIIDEMLESEIWSVSHILSDWFEFTDTSKLSLEDIKITLHKNGLDFSNIEEYLNKCIEDGWVNKK